MATLTSSGAVAGPAPSPPSLTPCSAATALDASSLDANRTKPYGAPRSVPRSYLVERTSPCSRKSLASFSALKSGGRFLTNRFSESSGKSRRRRAAEPPRSPRRARAGASASASASASGLALPARTKNGTNFVPRAGSGSSFPSLGSPSWPTGDDDARAWVSGEGASSGTFHTGDLTSATGAPAPAASSPSSPRSFPSSVPDDPPAQNLTLTNRERGPPWALPPKIPAPRGARTRRAAPSAMRRNAIAGPRDVSAPAGLCPAPRWALGQDRRLPSTSCATAGKSRGGCTARKRLVDRGL